MELETTFTCVYCFSVNEIIVDTSGGLEQEYIEDCEVCCRPNNLRITINETLTSAEVYADLA